MVRRKEEIRVRPSKNVRGGRGEVTFYDWMLPEDAPGHGRTFSKLVIPPGCSIGNHRHEGEFEAFYVLSGEATVHDNDTVVTLHAGDMHLCPDGSEHETENLSDEDLVMIALILNTLA